MRVHPLGPAVLIVAALGSSPAAAEGVSVEDAPPAPGISIGARLGYFEVDDVEEGTPVVGFTFGYEFHRVAALQLSLDYFDFGPVWAAVDDDSTLAGDAVEYGHSALAFQASLCVYPFPALHRVRPYLAGGLGYYRSRFEYEDGTGGHSGDGGYQAGAGTDILIVPQGDVETYLSVDFRYIFTHRSDDPDRVETDGILATVGVKFLF